MILEVDPGSAVPPFEQIRAQIAGLVTGGALPPGTRLPPIRQLAGDLGLAPGTVARAYRELEQTGLVASRGRHGTRVTEPAERTAVMPSAAHLDEAAATFAAAAGRAGSDLEQALDAVRRAFSRTDSPLTAETGGLA
ncbi:MAG TPA: GntR family transcriptional regulator [Acidimicrobiales bacterium]|nr:GntR family transcriptional regulator [Acidimicrobiales bacterium]